jgi:hypothetical protein
MIGVSTTQLRSGPGSGAAAKQQHVNQDRQSHGKPPEWGQRDANREPDGNRAIFCAQKKKKGGIAPALRAFGLDQRLSLSNFSVLRKNSPRKMRKAAE